MISEEREDFTVIPAHPGFFLIELIYPFDVDGIWDDQVSLDPIIGWAVHTDGSVVPVTCTGIAYMSPGYVVRPDNRVCDTTCDATWCDINAWVEHMVSTDGVKDD